MEKMSKSIKYFLPSLQSSTLCLLLNIFSPHSRAPLSASYCTRLSPCRSLFPFSQLSFLTHFSLLPQPFQFLTLTSSFLSQLFPSPSPFPSLALTFLSRHTIFFPFAAHIPSSIIFSSLNSLSFLITIFPFSILFLFQLYSILNSLSFLNFSFFHSSLSCLNLPFFSTSTLYLFLNSFSVSVA